MGVEHSNDYFNHGIAKPNQMTAGDRHQPYGRNNTSEDLVNADFDDSMRKFIGEAQKEINGMIMGNNTHIID